MGVRELARHVSYVPQDHRFAFGYSVRDIILMGRMPHGRSFFKSSQDDILKVKHIMARFGSDRLADMPVTQLSGGQRQIVIIARSVIQETPLMILEEPTSNLDWRNQIAVWEMLQRISQESRAGILVCSHDPNAVLQWADRAVIMHKGRILASGNPPAVMQPDILETVYGRPCRVIQTEIHGSSHHFILPV